MCYKMAHLPYRMYGSGGFHLPIIDIVQTINSSTHMCKRQKPSKPIITYSRKGLHFLKKESSSNEKLEKQLPLLCERKSLSYNSFPKESFVQEDEEKFKKIVTSKTKMRFRKNGLQTGGKFFNCCCDKESQRVGEKKSLQVLFKAGKKGYLFDKDEFDEDELNLPSLSGSDNSAANLKRKRSFADYIKIKRRKRIGS